MAPAQISTTTSSSHAPELSLLPAWNRSCLTHGFMTRNGGVSHGPYRSFNLAEAVGDDPAAVTANWIRWRTAYPNLRLARLQQVHGKVVHCVGTGDESRRKIGDGMVTGMPGIVLAIFTADCVPVLMLDAEAGVAGALHAGWRGILAGIAAEGMRAMMQLGARPHRIRVALGPSIGICCFEVDAELGEKFITKVPESAVCSRVGRPGKKHLDLRGILHLQFQQAGVDPAYIADIGPCTRCNSDQFFSRRAAGGVPTGLQMSFIGFDSEH